MGREYCSGVGGGEDDDRIKWPPWLRPLLQSSFFGQCKVHGAAAHKSECNMFCLDCISGPLCSHCLNFHKDHRPLQIRRSSYHDVIRVGEIQKYLDITGVQTYIINSAKIVFLNQRRPPQPRPGKGVTKTCCVCRRSLIDSFTFCSIGCKIIGTSKNFHKDKMRMNICGSDSDELTNGSKMHKQVTRNKVQRFTPLTLPQTAMTRRRSAKRRKGVPCRAPTGGLLMEY